MREGLDVAGVLSAAQDVIRARGWCRGSLEDSRGRVCLAGAVNTVVSGSPVTTSAFIGLPGYEFVQQAIEARGIQWGGITGWNDDRAMGEEDVIALLMEAEKRARNA